eukprot:226709-Chlamydomonas_euryale.AAC.3
MARGARCAAVLSEARPQETSSLKTAAVAAAAAAAALPLQSHCRAGNSAPSGWCIASRPTVFRPRAQDPHPLPARLHPTQCAAAGRRPAVYSAPGDPTCMRAPHSTPPPTAPPPPCTHAQASGDGKGGGGGGPKRLDIALPEDAGGEEELEVSDDDFDFVSQYGQSLGFLQNLDKASLDM